MSDEPKRLTFADLKQSEWCRLPNGHIVQKQRDDIWFDVTNGDLKVADPTLSVVRLKAVFKTESTCMGECGICEGC